MSGRFASPFGDKDVFHHASFDPGVGQRVGPVQSKSKHDFAGCGSISGYFAKIVKMCRRGSVTFSPMPCSVIGIVF